MIIQCDKCQSKYRLDESKVVGAGIKVKCTKCANVFIVRPPGYQESPAEDQAQQTAPPPPPPPPPKPTPPPTETKAPAGEFSFDAGSTGGADFKFEEPPKPSAEKNPFDFSAGGSGEMSNSDISAMFQGAGAGAGESPIGVSPSEWKIRTLSESETSKSAPVASNKDEAADKEKQKTDFATQLEIEHDHARKEALLKKKEIQRRRYSEEGGPSTVKKLAVLFLTIAALYYYMNYDEINKEVEGTQTFQKVKSTVTGIKPAPAAIKKLEVLNITAYYVVNKKSGNVFVISALVSNSGDTPLTLKGAKGILMDQTGKKLTERTTSPGRVLSEEDLKTLSAKELQKLPKDADTPVEVKPMTTLPLQFIFVKIPEGMTEYGVDITQ